MSENEKSPDVAPGSESVEFTIEVNALEELRAWFHANKTTPEFLLAQKHRHAMAPGVAEELKARAPGETDEERELAFMFSLVQIAEHLDMVGVLMAGIQVEHLPPVESSSKEPEVVATSHIDVTPLVEVPPHES